MGPGCLHAVWASEDTLFAGGHFYTPRTMHQSLRTIMHQYFSSNPEEMFNEDILERHWAHFGNMLAQVAVSHDVLRPVDRARLLNEVEIAIAKVENIEGLKNKAFKNFVTRLTNVKDSLTGMEGAKPAKY